MRLLGRPLAGIAAIATFARHSCGRARPRRGRIVRFPWGTRAANDRPAARRLSRQCRAGHDHRQVQRAQTLLRAAPAKAIAYPIGAPMGEARWSGVTHISSRRINPMWTPTSDMRRENPTLPAYVPGGHPRNPLGVRALYLGASTTASTAPTRPGPWARRSAMAASACIITTSTIFIIARPSAPVSWSNW